MGLLLKLLPWRWVLCTAAVAGLFAGALWEIKKHDDRVFAAGAASVQKRWDALEFQRAGIANEAQRQNALVAAARQADTDALAARVAAERVVRAADLAGAHADNERMRKLIDSVTGANRYPGVAAAASSSGSDATALALGELLDACDRVATQSGADAEGLADQVRGLQSFILTIKKNP